MSKMNCPSCGERGSRIVKTYQTRNGVKRAHRCDTCDTRFFGVELPLDVLRKLVGAEQDLDIAARIDAAYREVKDDGNKRG